MDDLDNWIERQSRCAIDGMLMSVSPLSVVKARPGFDQHIRARKGAIVASPVPASYDPDPDYFFHWYRDSAVVIDALRLLHLQGRVGQQGIAHLADFVDFSLALSHLDGAEIVARADRRARVAPDFQRYLRSDAELAAVRGAAVAAETRVNPDATLDISLWARPQHDGPALRALALLRWLAGVALARSVAEPLARLVDADLEFTLEHWRTPSYDIWEEEPGLHYYTLRVSAAALEAGAAWRATLGDARGAQRCSQGARDIRGVLEDFWLTEAGADTNDGADHGANHGADKRAGYYRSRMTTEGARSPKELDIAVILAAVHADGSGAHSAQDPRMHATLQRLETLFDAEYAINRARSPQEGPAMGRYAGDHYYSGGAYYFSTLGAAEFCFQAARTGPSTRTWIERGDAYLRTVRRYTPPGGEMSEQFDRGTGAQTSARHLAWSYAAFLSCVAARRAIAGVPA